MNNKQKKRFIAIIILIALVGGGLGLVLFALKQNINLFYTPTELTQHITQPEQHLRIGGYVKKNTVHYSASGESVTFVITDQINDIAVSYHGVLPSLFREGQGVVVTGKLNTQHQFLADQVLAKHDEKYMPWSLDKKLQSQRGQHAS